MYNCRSAPLPVVYADMFDVYPTLVAEHSGRYEIGIQITISMSGLDDPVEAWS